MVVMVQVDFVVKSVLGRFLRKRKEINEKVSSKLKGKSLKQNVKVIKKCEHCNQEFETFVLSQRFCNRKCSNAFAGGKKKPGNGGPRPGGGKSRVYEYISPVAGKMKLNNDEIEIAKILDKLDLKWLRNDNIGFSYCDLDQVQRKYYPDFYLVDYDLFIEYKGWVDKKLIHKMSDAQQRNSFKLLIIYSNDKRYKGLGLNLEMLKNDNSILLKYLGV